jgi:hypothetical protein
MPNSKLALFVVLLQYKNSERAVSEKGLSHTKKKTNGNKINDSAR